MAKRVHRFNVGGVAGKKCKDFRGQSKEFRVSWDSIHFLASLWAFCSKVFKGIPLNVLQRDWLAVCN